MFNFEVSFESEWYMSLVYKEGGKSSELAILDYQHETVPLGFRHISSGLIINLEVEDATEIYNKLVVKKEINLVKELKDEDFGQRHFIIADPVGVLVDVIENIPPSDAFLKMYNGDT
jgi:hypothetical protein